MRILRSGQVFGRPGGLLREVWGVWGTILAPIGWVGWRNGSGAGKWMANGASNGSLGGGGLAPGREKPSEPDPPTRVLLDYLQYIRICCALYTP